VQETDDAPMHPIQAVARRTGLTPDVIRAWERRYSAVTPGRSGTRRRLYSESDVERLLLLRRATLAGRRIGDVAHLPDSELAPLVAADELAASRVPRPVPFSSDRPSPESYRASILDAARRLDGTDLEAVLRRAARELSAEALIGDVLGPAMRAIGDGWADGSVGVCSEHLATAIIRSLLDAMRSAQARGFAGPDIVIATPQHQRHELGALMAAVIAAADGWQVTYLGSDLPAAEIARAVRDVKAGVVALSVVYPTADQGTADELLALARALPRGVDVVMGGRAADSYAEVAKETGIRILSSNREFSSMLEARRSASSG
jgi:methanogenic corrinoid protein MtbC1